MYDRDKYESFVFPEWDFGDGATVDIVSFRLPPGMQGNLVNVGVAITETFACDSTAALVEVGTIADPDAYASLTVPDDAADTDFFDVSDDTDAIISHTGESQIAADSLISLKGTVGVDAGTEAGKGLVILTFRVWV
ncbi:MAG: hypothetical protein JRC90_10465 [Deltaproteobacteria bacterium]|nr:hypothetical protein [Deltaproteobacteria bacterium]